MANQQQLGNKTGAVTEIAGSGTKDKKKVRKRKKLKLPCNIKFTFTNVFFLIIMSLTYE